MMFACKSRVVFMHRIISRAALAAYLAIWAVGIASDHLAAGWMLDRHLPIGRQREHPEPLAGESSPQSWYQHENQQWESSSSSNTGRATQIPVDDPRGLGGANEEQRVDAELLELLVEFYARTSQETDGRNRGRELDGAKLKADSLEWLRRRQKDFDHLRDLKFAVVEGDQPPAARRIHTCADGPKILVSLSASGGVGRCFTQAQWEQKLWADLRLSWSHLLMIVANAVVFLVGTTGNVFVCISVYRNLQLRSVTNYFIVNLAFADLLVILICLPATVVWDLLLTWFFGTTACKLIMFLQDVSISVSVLTLTAISIDRYYAICYPLRFKSSLSQAKKIIALIWVISLLIMSPDLFYLRAEKSAELVDSGLDTILYSDCNYQWGERASKLFQFVKTVLLYLSPFALMMLAHYKIMRTLNLASEAQSYPSFKSSRQPPSNLQNIPEQLQHHQYQVASESISVPSSIDISISSVQLDASSAEEVAMSSPPPSSSLNNSCGSQQQVGGAVVGKCSDGGGRCAYREPKLTGVLLSINNRGQLESRRTAARMLAAIVIIFGICYLPVHLINFLRQFVDDIPQNDLTSTLSMFAHLICYLNSAINPIIYNHMNSVFRAEFKKSLACCLWRTRDESNTTISTNREEKTMTLMSNSRSTTPKSRQQNSCVQLGGLTATSTITKTTTTTRATSEANRRGSQLTTVTMSTKISSYATSEAEC